MWQFDYPWLLLAWPLAGLGYRFLPPYREARSAVRVPFFAAMSRAVNQSPHPSGTGSNPWQLVLNVLVWTLLVVAVARPVSVEKPIEHTQPVRDLMLAIDLSQSMETTDFTDANGQKTNRLAAVKQVMQGFIERRKNDRTGLIVFGSGAYPQAPLTLDHASLSLLLQDTGIGMAGPNTAIGDAIGLSLKLLEHTAESEKVLILLTDGNDTHSAIPPVRAASMAAAKGVIVHTIGIGDPSADGDARVDLATLQTIASTTGGRSFRAEDRDSLNQVYATLDRITPQQVNTLSHQPKRDLFWLPVALAISLLTLYHTGALLAARLRQRPSRQAL